MNKINTMINLVVSWVMYWLSFLIPKDKKIWVFIGWHQNKQRELFADNSKYLFLYVANKRKDVRAIWIGKDDQLCKILTNRGYEAYSIHSFKGAVYSLRAGYTIIDAMMTFQNWRYSGRSRVVQLWHGKSLKKTGFNSPYSLPRYGKFRFPNLFRSVWRFVAMSEYMANFIVSDFRIKKGRILITGLPRHDVLFGDIRDSEIDVNEDLKNKIRQARLKNIRKLIFYGPTFRPDGSNPLLQLRLPDLNTFLATKNYFLIGSLHPKFSTHAWMPEIQFTNISFVESGYDIYPLIQNFDLLITDYSSLGIEFLLIDKPAIFFVYDLEKFKRDMGIYEDLWNVIPGPKVKTFDELLAILENADNGEYKKGRAIARQKLFDFSDNNASKRIAERILCDIQK